jgi:tRNA(Ile)-lysidine synthase
VSARRRLARALAGLDEIVDVTGLEAPVVVACSGGADSLAALAAAAAAGLRPVAVHVDHGLRPESAGEVPLVAAAAARLGTDFESVRLDLAAGANLEARAREARYRALERARRDLGATVVLTGHTADDQAETVLLNLLRGAATTGLAGMGARSGTIARPLLRLRRADTVEICARLGLAPVHDAMNDDLSYRRVWVRREVIPALARAANRDLIGVLARQAEVMGSESAMLDALAAEAWPAGGEATTRGLIDLPIALARRAVRGWLGAPPPSFAEVERVLAVARGECRAVELAGGRRVERCRGRLSLVTSVEAPGPAVALPGMLSGMGLRIESWLEREAPVRWPDGRWTCVVDGGAGDGRTVRLTAAPGGRVALIDTAGVPLWTVGYGVGPTARVHARTRHFLWITATDISERTGDRH